MARRIYATSTAADILVINAITSAFPPVLAAFVSSSWTSGQYTVPEFDIDVSAAGATAPTAMLLYGAEPETTTIAGTTFTAATTDICTAASHGLITGDGPVQLTNSGGALPAGLALLTDYYIIYLTVNTFSFAASRALAFAGTAVDVTGTGTGTHTYTGNTPTAIKWRKIGTLAAAPTLSLREGFVQRVDHNPKFVAYGCTWTGGTTNAVKVKICPVSS